MKVSVELIQNNLNKLMFGFATKILFIFYVLTTSLSAFASNGRTTYQAKIIKPDGYPLEASSVSFRFTVLDSVGSCVLYVEDYAAVNMNQSTGLISFSLGNGNRTFPASGSSMTFHNTFDNSVPAFSCQTPGIYNPGPNDTRKIVMQFNDGNGWQTLPAMTINAVPYAMFASRSDDSKTLNGKTDSAFVEASTLAGLNCTATQAIKFNNATFSCIEVPATASGGITSLTTSGSVLTIGGTASAPVISIQAATLSQDGYLTSLDYAEFKAKLSASGTEIINTLGESATASATANTLVKRDESGSIRLNEIYANTAKINYIEIYKPSTSFSIRLQSPTSLNTNYILNLPSTSGTIGQVLSTDGNGNLTWINPSTGSVVSVSAVAPLVATGGANPIISITQADSSRDGYLSSDDWNTFNNKQIATSAAIIATLGFIPADEAVSGTYVQKASNLSDLTNILQARTNLGLGSFATASTIDLGSASATGIVAEERLKNQLNVISGTQYIKVTVDGKGRVTSGAQLSSGDVTAALGYTPATSTTLAASFIQKTGDSMNGILNLAQGTSTSASLKFTSGTLLTSPESGTIEYDGTQLYFTDGGNIRRALASNSSPGSFDNTSSISNTSGHITLSPNNITGSVIVNSSAASISSGTGALVVNGGVGIAGNISAGGNLNLTGSATIGQSLALSQMTSGSLLFAGAGGVVSQDNASLFWDGATKRLGLGTNNPVSLLSVKGQNPSLTLETSDGTGSSSIIFPGNFATWSIRNQLTDGPDNDLFGIYNSAMGANQLTLRRDGYVGIGTSSPTRTLHVLGSQLIERFAANPQLILRGGTNSSTGSDWEFHVHPISGNLFLARDPSDGSVNDNAPIFNVTNYGNVGIGTTTPQSNLSIGSNIGSGYALTANSLSPYGINVQTSEATPTANPAFWVRTTPDTGTTVNTLFRIQNNGNVGVGTSNPAFKLDIRGPATTGVAAAVATVSLPDIIGNRGGLAIGNAAGGVLAGFTGEVVGTGAYPNSVGRGDIWVQNGASTITAATFLANGNVGIGTTAPSAKLVVDAGSVNDFAIRDNSIENHKYDHDGAEVAVNYVGYQAGTSRFRTFTVYNGKQSALATFQGSTGNVGIGTTAPVTPLHISTGGVTGWNSVLKLETTNINTHPLLMFRHAGADTGYVGFGDSNGANGFGIYNYKNDDLTLGTSSTTMVSIKPSGNVGIGITTPTEKLEVNGFVKAHGFKTSALSVGTELLYIRGTGLNNSASRLVKLGNQTLVSSNARGLMLTIIEASTHNHVSSMNYDVYGSATESDNLASALNNLTRDRIGILSSFDSWEGNLTANLRAAARRLGLYKLAASTEYRAPYAAIFYGAGTSTNNTEVGRQAYEILQSGDADSSYAVVTTWLTEDGFIGQNLTNALMSGNPNIADPVVLVNSSGNVGIGTTSPNKNLTLGSNIVTQNNSGGDRIYSTIGAQTNGSNYNVGSIKFIQPDTHYQDAGAIAFFSAYGTEVERMRITPLGNIGIGTTSPISPIEIRGGAIMSGGWNRTMRLQASHPAIQLKGTGGENKSAWIEYDDAASTNGLSLRVGGTDDDIGTAIRALSIAGSGNVGIGNISPSYKLDVSGDVRATGSVAAWSDIRTKKNIEIIPESLHKILQIHGVTFDWRTSEFPDKNFKTDRDIGVIAQEVEKVFPEAVRTDTEGYKSVVYSILIAPIIEAIRELYAQLSGLKQEYELQKREISALKEKVVEVELLRNENKILKDYLCQKDNKAAFCVK